MEVVGSEGQLFAEALSAPELQGAGVGRADLDGGQFCGRFSGRLHALRESSWRRDLDLREIKF